MDDSGTTIPLNGQLGHPTTLEHQLPLPPQPAFFGHHKRGFHRRVLESRRRLGRRYPPNASTMSRAEDFDRLHVSRASHLLVVSRDEVDAHVDRERREWEEQLYLS